MIHAAKNSRVTITTISKFLNNKSWRFVDNEYQFPNPTNPWTPTFPELKNFNNLFGNQKGSFIGVKIGDLSGDASANRGNLVSFRSNDPIKLYIDNPKLKKGDKFSVPVKMIGTDELDGIQFSLGFNSKVLKLDDYENHYKIIYEYMAGENSLVNKIYKFDNITVENEYALPHSTVARVKFGNLSSTIITHALPVSKFKTILFVKAYRSYWSFDLNNSKNQNIFYPIMHFINQFGDQITHNTMYSTLKQDKAIVDNIDKKDYASMHGKFSIVYDMFSNHYKNNYKMFYEVHFHL
jgi:hypothetical protein